MITGENNETPNRPMSDVRSSISSSFTPIAITRNPSIMMRIITIPASYTQNNDIMLGMMALLAMTKMRIHLQKIYL